MTNEEANIIQGLFVPATEAEKAGTQVMREPTTYWQDAWRRFRRNKVAMVAAVVILVVCLVAILGPLFSEYTYDQQIKGSELLRPFEDPSHPLGTDSLGRDYFVRLMMGARISLAIGIVSCLMIVSIGVLYGAVSGYFGGWVDNVMMRAVDIIWSVPTLLIVILLSVVLKQPLADLFARSDNLKNMVSVGPGLISIFFTLSTLYWVDMARMVRGQILLLKEMEYVNAARALGAKSWRIMTRHLIPNSIGVILVTGTLKIPTAIFTEAFLSFIGLGVSAPMASLGSLASDALNGIYSYPHLLTMPSILISLIILSFNLVGDGLRDALDPRMKSKG